MLRLHSRGEVEKENSITPMVALWGELLPVNELQDHPISSMTRSPSPRSLSYCMDFRISVGQRLLKSILICFPEHGRRLA
jgi:hypothetical protein